jgi:hypothetical protein
VAGGVGDDPVPPEQLHRVVAFVRDAHRVDEDPLALERLRPIGREPGLDFDANVVRDGFRRRGVQRLNLEFRHGPPVGFPHDIN